MAAGSMLVQYRWMVSSIAFVYINAGSGHIPDAIIKKVMLSDFWFNFAGT